MKESRWTPEQKKDMELFTLRKRVEAQRKTMSQKDRKIRELEEKLRKAEEIIDMIYGEMVCEVQG